MRAVVCSELGSYEALSIGELPDPTPGAGRVVVDVHRASFNFPDLLLIRGEYQFSAEPPFAPGAEGAGIVSAVGPGVEGLSLGDRVAAFGSNGAFAERWPVDATGVIALPDAVSFDVGATTPLTYGTSYHALVDRAGLRAGETLLVLGAAGGVGSAAVDIGAALGARVIAAASTQEKLDFCRDLGASETVDYRRDDLRQRLKEITSGAGVDVIYDPVGGPMTEQAFRSIAWGGRHLVIGFANGDIPALPLNLPLLKGGSIVGVFWGSFAARDPQANRRNLATVYSMIEAGDLTPQITDHLPLAEFRRGFAALAERAAMGKIVLDVR